MRDKQEENPSLSTLAETFAIYGDTFGAIANISQKIEASTEKLEGVSEHLEGSSSHLERLCKQNDYANELVLEIRHACVDGADHLQAISQSSDASSEHLDGIRNHLEASAGHFDGIREHFQASSDHLDRIHDCLETGSDHLDGIRDHLLDSSGHLKDIRDELATLNERSLDGFSNDSQSAIRDELEMLRSRVSGVSAAISTLTLPAYIIAGSLAFIAYRTI